MPKQRRLHLKHYLVAAVFACLGLVLAIQQYHVRGINSLSERNGDWYLGLAENLAEGNGYRNCRPAVDSHLCDPSSITAPTAYRLPGYPVYLAANLLIFGIQQPVVAIRLLQCVLLAMTTFLCTLIAARYIGIAGIVFVGSALLFDISLFYNLGSFLLTENLFTLLLVAFVVLATKVTSARGYLAAGVVLGAAMLTRGTLVFLLPLLLLVIPFRRLPVFAAGLLLLIVPWTIRNYTVFHAIVPFSTGSGDVIWGANNPVMFGLEPPIDSPYWDTVWQAGVPTGSWAAPNELPRFAELTGLNELDRDRAKQQFALDFLATVPPDLLLRATAAKLIAFFVDTPAILPLPVVLQIELAVWGSVLVVCIFDRQFRSSLRNWLTSRTFRVTLIIFIAFIVNAVVFYGQQRFRRPFDPLFALWSGVGVALIAQGIHRRVLLALIAVAVAVMLVAATAIVVLHQIDLSKIAAATEIRDQVGEAQLDFSVSRGQSNCASAQWDVTGIRAIYLNNSPTVGQHAEQVCNVSSLTWHVIFQDGSTHDYELVAAPYYVDVQGILKPYQQQVTQAVENPVIDVFLISFVCLLSVPMRRKRDALPANADLQALPG